MKKAQNHPQITKEYLDSILRYDPDTGFFHWRVTRSQNAKEGGLAGSIRTDGYTRILVRNKLRYAHRLAWISHYGNQPTEEIDHIDQNPLNNAISNLRLVTHKENHRNKGLCAINTSGVNGVYLFKSRGKWVANITVDNKTVYLGIYEDFFDAVCARKSADIKYGFHANHGQSL